MSNTYDPIIRMSVEKYFPELLEDLSENAWLHIKAQIWQESRFDPEAVSCAGAKGLMQLMPNTAYEMGVKDPFSPVQSIEGGVKYLAGQYRRFSEIQDCKERLKFAQAAYNGGRGYVNIALALAREFEGLPFGYKAWMREGRQPGLWQMWEYASDFLDHRGCVVKGKHPDHQQITEYVSLINDRYEFYRKEDM